MRLKTATLFALTFFALLAFMLIRISSKMPEPATRSPAFAFDHTAVDGRAAFSILERFLEISPRNSGTPGAARAAEFLFNELKTSGIQPAIDEFTDLTPAGKITFRNVTAIIPGSSSNCIVLISHYDTKSGMPAPFTGANDSGSSTALLLQLASVFKNSTNTIPDIMLAFVDGEECMEYYSKSDGLHGSKRLAAALASQYGKDNILAAIVLDMIGDKDLSVTVPRNSSPNLISRLFDAAHKENARHLFSLYNPIIDDHVPFLQMGIPALNIIDFHYGSAPFKNDYWHTEEDSIDKISADSLDVIGRITVRLINSIIAKPLN